MKKITKICCSGILIIWVVFSICITSIQAMARKPQKEPASQEQKEELFHKGGKAYKVLVLKDIVKSEDVLYDMEIVFKEGTTVTEAEEILKKYNLEIVHNTHRNMLIWSTAVNETRNHRKVLILVNTLEHEQILLDMLSPLKDELKIIAMNGQSKDRDQDMSVYDIILATSIYDEGYNLPSLDTLILAGAGRSAVKVTQRVGRVLRQKADGRIAKVYDFIDLPKYIKAQYLKRRKLLAEEFEIIEQEAQMKLGGI